MSDEFPDLDDDESSKKFYKAAFDNRFATLRQAKEKSDQNVPQEAVQLYLQYINIVARFKNVEEKDLAPGLFDSETDLSEMLVISHTYWDLAKIYDRSPKLGGESIRCLGQFAKFTIGQKFHYANSNMVKNYIRKKKAHDLNAFKLTHDKIKGDLKECFIATYCFQEENQTILTLRKFRNQLYKNKFGEKLVDLYYFTSPRFIHLLNKLPGEKKQFKKVISFMLKAFARVYER